MEALNEPFKITFAAAIVALGVAGGGIVVASAVKIGKFGLQTLKNGMQGFAKGVGQRYGESSWGQHRKEKKEEKDRETRAGNYSGYNPARRVRSVVNRGINRSSALNKLTGGYTGNRELEDSLTRRKNREDVARVFGDDTTLARAWIETRGRASRDDLEARGLNDAQIRTYQQLNRTGRHKQGESYMAAIQMMANSGEGDGALIGQAFDEVKNLNPGSYLTDTGNMGEALRATYRSRGRGDLVFRDAPLADHGHVDGFSAGPTDQGWGDISLENLSRHAINNPAGRASLARWIAQDEANERRFLVGLSRMEGRAQNIATEIYTTDMGMDPVVRRAALNVST